MLDRIALILVIIGALNWGGIGIFGFDTVAWLCGGQTAIFCAYHLHIGRNRRYLVHFAAVQARK